MKPEEANEHLTSSDNTGTVNSTNTDKNQHAISMAFMLGIAGMSTLGGFSYTLALAKKKDPGMFNKGLVGSQGVPESGSALALRALGRGTVYAVSGFGLFCFVVWKVMGVHSMKEFGAKVQSVMPKVPKNEPQGKTDFKSAQELVDYIIHDGERTKDKKS